jgi:hypothetical protein
MKGRLTDKERRIVVEEYERHKHDNICPHTTNPLRLMSLCKRCRELDKLNISVYQVLPHQSGGDWTASSAGVTVGGFASRAEAEEWAITMNKEEIK